MLRFVTVLIVVAAGAALTPVGKRIPAVAVRWWCRTIVRSAGIRLRITGTTTPTGGLLLVANHISWLDIPLLAAVRPARMLAKAEIRHWPVAGTLTAGSGALFIDRDRLRALPETVASIAGALRAGERSPSSPRAAPGAAGPRGTSGGPSSRPRWTPGSPSSPSACTT